MYEKNIKIVYFFRDDHYRLAKEFLDNTLKTKFIGAYDRLFSNLLNATIRKYTDIVYFPSDSMQAYFDFKSMKNLPPAAR